MKTENKKSIKSFKKAEIKNLNAVKGGVIGFVWYPKTNPQCKLCNPDGSDKQSLTSKTLCLQYSSIFF